jgi:alpha-beta hydrolase superfamily lysophospholipase
VARHDVTGRRPGRWPCIVRWLSVVVGLALLGAACSSDDGTAGGSATTTSVVEVVPEAPEGDAFYEPPDPLPSGAPGDIIWTEQLVTPEGMVGWRVLYHSQSVAGQDIAVSGLIYAPEDTEEESSSAAADDRVVFAWAHGTVGLGDDCAPSKDPGGGSSELAARYVQRGLVVAMTDFEGLGTPGVHPYVVGLSEGRGMLDSVRAARNLTATRAGDQTILGGHSQGGGAALVAGEIAPTYAPELDVLGVVAGAPAAELRLIASAVSNGPYFGYLAMAAAGFHAAYPNLPLDAVLTPVAIDELEQVDDLCAADIISRFAGRVPSTVVAADPGTVEPWASLLEENSPGVRQPASPVFMFHGDADEVIPAAASQLVLDRYCRAGGVVPVERRVYPGQSHAGVLAAAQPDIDAFIEARLAGDDPASSCPATT